MNIVPFSAESPFDSICRFDSEGNEYWLARELMPLLEYKSWQKFNNVIDNARENLETVTERAIHHIIPIDKMVKRPQGGGSKLLDYKLSRLACYHIALCCDSRGNDAVKTAKHYFAIKTREAEVVIPKQSEQIELTKLEIQRLTLINENLRMQTNFLDRREAIATLQGVKFLALLDCNPNAVVEIKEVVTETVVCRGNSNVSFTGKSTAQVAKEYGFKTGKELESWLAKNKADHLICQGMRAVQAPYIPEENLAEIKNLFANKRKNTTRQLNIGE
jgi:hypothetical protein